MSTIFIKVHNWADFTRGDIKSPNWIKLPVAIFESSDFFDYSPTDKMAFIYTVCQCAKNGDGVAKINLNHAFVTAGLKIEDFDRLFNSNKNLEQIQQEPVSVRTRTCADKSVLRIEENRIDKIRKEEKREECIFVEQTNNTTPLCEEVRIVKNKQTPPTPPRSKGAVLAPETVQEIFALFDEVSWKKILEDYSDEFLETEAQKMIDWSHANGKKKISWKAAFRNWIKNNEDRLDSKSRSYRLAKKLEKLSGHKGVPAAHLEDM